MLEIIPLGAGQEVGRSCILLKFKGRTILLDCGIHPGLQGLNALPFFDMIDDPAEIDMLLVSHFHLDHAASLPYFLSKTTFQGRVYMTRATKRIYRLLLQDYVKVTNISISDSMLYDESDLQRTAERIQEVEFHQEVEHAGVKFTCYHAGHVLGAAMFQIDIGGVRVLYTGDYCRAENRHLPGAEVPPHSPDVLIIESTFGIQILSPREEREKRFLGHVESIIERGGHVLIPSFALGNTQELLLILEEHWDTHPELQRAPVYYASALARRCNAVYQECVHDMNDAVRRRHDAGERVFNFKHISYMASLKDFRDQGPCVVLASPGMLQSGMSRDLFERWCQSDKNGVIIPGYSVEGTLAKEIMAEPTRVMSMRGHPLPLRMSVHYVSFSAHADFRETSTFIDKLLPPNVVLVHGEANEMNRLRNALARRYESNSLQLHTPANCESIFLPFHGNKVAKVVGKLAAHPPADGRVLSGLLVRKDFTDTVIAPDDVTSYTQLKTSTIEQQLSMRFYQPFDLLKAALHQIFSVENLACVDDDGEPTAPDEAPGAEPSPDDPSVWVQRVVRISMVGAETVTFRWIADPVNDMVADTCVAMALHIEQSPLSFKAAARRISRPQDEAADLAALLERRFGAAKVDPDDLSIAVTRDSFRAVAKIDFLCRRVVVSCDDEEMREEVAIASERALNAMGPIPLRQPINDDVESVQKVQVDEEEAFPNPEALGLEKI